MLKIAFQMKRIFSILLSVFVFMTTYAQNEKNDAPDGSLQKEFNGFILDMGAMLNVESIIFKPFFPTFNHLGTGFSAGEKVWGINPEVFRLNPDITYFKSFESNPGTFFPLHSPATDYEYPWQGAGYRLKNGIRINTYGEYNADGYRKRSLPATPWQKNDFKAAFEMKSSNGNFGIKLEVQRGRNYPY